MATTPRFRIDVDIHNLLMHSSPRPVKLPVAMGMTLPEAVFPQFPNKLADPGPSTLPEHRGWQWPEVYRKMRGWLFPYIRSRVLPGDFHPITAYLFVEYKCNLDCWYCWRAELRRLGSEEGTRKHKSGPAAGCLNATNFAVAEPSRGLRNPVSIRRHLLNLPLRLAAA